MIYNCWLKGAQEFSPEEPHTIFIWSDKSKLTTLPDYVTSFCISQYFEGELYQMQPWNFMKQIKCMKSIVQTSVI